MDGVSGSPPPDLAATYDFAGRCAVVTGAGSGMGRRMSEVLAHQGCTVLVVDVDEGKAQQTAAALNAFGSAEAMVVDVTDAGAASAIVERAVTFNGRLDVLINNAGVLADGQIHDQTDERWDTAMAVNVAAPMRLIREALTVMRPSRSGSIVNIGSSWSSRGSVLNTRTGSPEYCASKAALHSVTRSAAQEAAPFGVRVNTIAPGIVDTPMHVDHRAEVLELARHVPLGRLQRPDDLDGIVLFLASTASAYITGQTFHVNGGLIMPD
jgi:NAD(P)-dependent dehydrogenase (short-subunit alcohol dehydrogenase family)